MGGGGVVTSEAGCKTKEDADGVKSCEIIKYSPNICVTLSVQKHYRPHSSFQVSDRLYVKDGRCVDFLFHVAVQNEWASEESQNQHVHLLK